MILDTEHPSNEQVEKLLAEWAKDASMDRLEPAEELRKIPKHQSKYLTILSTHRRAYKEGERRMAKMRRVKLEYYTGRLDQATLSLNNWQPFPYTLKGDLNTYLESDKDILAGKKAMSTHEEVMDLCERILKELSSRTFALKDIIRWEIFIAGGGH